MFIPVNTNGGIYPMKVYYEPVNLAQWDMFSVVKNIGHVEPFLATKSMEIGDIMLLHVGQQDKRYDSGVYAVGEIVNGPYILRDHPNDYCNSKLTVDVKICMIDHSVPYITHEACKEFIRQFRTVHKIESHHYPHIMSLLGSK
jgi:hypothetical protein